VAEKVGTQQAICWNLQYVKNSTLHLQWRYLERAVVSVTERDYVNPGHLYSSMW